MWCCSRRRGWLIITCSPSWRVNRASNEALGRLQPLERGVKHATRELVNYQLTPPEGWEARRARLAAWRGVRRLTPSPPFILDHRPWRGSGGGSSAAGSVGWRPEKALRRSLDGVRSWADVLVAHQEVPVVTATRREACSALSSRGLAVVHGAKDTLWRRWWLLRLRRWRRWRWRRWWRRQWRWRRWRACQSPR